MKVESRFILDAILCVGLCALCVNGKTACIRTSSNSQIQPNLTCSENQMVHVVSELVGYADTSSTSCQVSRTITNCTEHRITDRTGLIVNCNGHSSCDEYMSTSISKVNCSEEISDAAAEIEYECIEGSVDMCSGHSVIDNGPLYLHSPGFPGNNKTVSNCQCTVSGVDLNVMLLHYQATYGAFRMHANTDVVWPTSNYNTVAYNRNIPIHYSSNLTIIYYINTDENQHRIWIRITGAKTLSCTNSTLPSPSTTVQTVTPVNTSPSVDKTDSTTVDRTSSTETSTLTSSKTSTSLKTTAKASTSSRPTNTSSTTVNETSSTESSTSPVGLTTANSTIVASTSTTESSSLNTEQKTINSPLSIVWLTTAVGVGVIVVILTSILVFVLCRRCHRRKPDNTVKGYDVPENTPATSHDYELPPVNNYCEIEICQLDPSFGTGVEQETLKSKETPLHHYFECDPNFTKSGSPADYNHSDGTYGWPRAANGIKSGEQKTNHANTYDDLDTWNNDDTTTAGRDVDVCLGEEHVFDESHVVDQNQSHMVDNDIYCGGSDDGTSSRRLSDMNLPPKYKPGEGQSVDQSHMVDNEIYCAGPADDASCSRSSSITLQRKSKPTERQSYDEIDINELKGHEDNVNGTVKDDDGGGGWVANDVYPSNSDV